MVVKHWPRPGVDPTMAMDYLCLQSGHNHLSKTLQEYIDMKFKMEIDVVRYFFNCLKGT